MSRGNRGRTPAILQIFAGALKAWWDDDALRLGASLAYYTLFAIAPVLLVATGIAGLVFNTDAVREEIVSQLDHLVGREGARAVQSLLDGASQRRAGIVATAIGSVAFVTAREETSSAYADRSRGKPCGQSGGQSARRENDGQDIPTARARLVAS